MKERLGKEAGDMAAGGNIIDNVCMCTGKIIFVSCYAFYMMRGVLSDLCPCLSIVGVLGHVSALASRLGCKISDASISALSCYI